MATENSIAAASATRLSYSADHRVKNSVRYKGPIQKAPPLSIRQFLRSATGVITGAKEWAPSGRYHPPTFHYYASPEVRVQPRIVEPVWRAPGRYIHERPTSLSPETRPQNIPKMPVWKPTGKVIHKPVPYFDPPNLRWSVEKLRRSMIDMRSTELPLSRSSSARRHSKVTETT